LGGILLWKNLNQPKQEANKTSNERVANDSGDALKNSLQSYAQVDTSTKFKVYAEGVSVLDSKGNTVGDTNIPIMQMTESCSYSDGTQPIETKYTLGPTATEVHNHCLLTFKQATAFMTSEYLNAYIVLPDNSLIVLSSQDSPSIQVNIYDNETRIVQVNGYAYYRIEKQTENHKFTTQISDVLLQVTGTEYYAKAAEDQKNTLWGSFQMLEGSAKLLNRSGKFIYDMLIPDDYDYGTLNSSSGWKEEGTWDSDEFSYNPAILYPFTSTNGVSQQTDPKVATVMAPKEPTDFLADQVRLTLKEYGFGNFTKNIGNNIEAMVSEEIESVEDLRRDTLATRYANQSEFWDEYQAAVEEENNSSSSSSSSGSNNSSSTTDNSDCVTSGATYQLCTMGVSVGSSHMDGSKCCFDIDVPEPTLENAQ
jgi:hypothetical protein